jgi:hypothetical protein
MRFQGHRPSVRLVDLRFRYHDLWQGLGVHVDLQGVVDRVDLCAQLSELLLGLALDPRQLVRVKLIDQGGLGLPELIAVRLGHALIERFVVEGFDRPLEDLPQQVRLQRRNRVDLSLFQSDRMQAPVE